MSETRAETSQGAGLVLLDQDLFDAHFDRYPFKLSHRLVEHPLLQLPRLVQLARDRGGQELYFRGDHQINQVDDDGPGQGSRAVAARDESTKRTFLDRQLSRPKLSASETIAQIESSNAWLQFRDVGADLEYAALLSQLIDEFRPYAERVAPGLSVPRADIFVSSPGATTPFHLDEEHNFLLQIRGSKRLSVANGFEPEAVRPDTVADFFRGSGELAPYCEQLEQHSVHVELAPGEGVHIPPCHPHWVQNGNAVSVSLGILWFSDVTARRRHLYRLNRWFERLGLRLPAPGARPALDSVAALPVTVKRRLRRALGG